MTFDREPKSLHGVRTRMNMTHLRIQPAMIRLLLFVFAGATTGHGYLLREAPDFSERFATAEVRGTLAVFDLDLDTFWFHNRVLAERGYLPASTFKIPHTLFALDAGVVGGADTAFAWNGERTWNPRWNRDHTLGSAFRESVVWVYQEIARAIGPERMRGYLRKVGYGNGRPGGPIDQFWLSGGLRISPYEQVQFLQRLYFNELPFAPAHQELLKNLMILDRGPGWVLRGKTGWAVAPDPDIGWFVGWLESPKGVFFFAACLQMTDDSQARLRKQLVLDVLRARGWMPE